MTGFATKTISLHTPTTSVPATLTLKSLNSRFIEVTCKLPYAFGHLETDIIKKCKVLSRGSLFFTVNLTSSAALKTAVLPSLPLAEGYLAAINTIQKKLNIPGTIEIADFLALPLFETAEDPSIAENANQILTTVDELIELLKTARALEGTALQADLEQRMAIVHNNMQEIEPRILQINEQRKEHFVKEISAAITTAPADLKDLHLQALYKNLENIDVHEEIVRFKNHLTNFSKTLHDTTEQKGKKLDFILQELFREINTLNAKLPDVLTSNPIMSIKVELEKAREQVQNIV